MLALLAVTACLAAPETLPTASDARTTVGRSLIRVAPTGGSTESGPSADPWSAVGLPPRLSVGSAIPEPGLVPVRQPERGFPGLTDGGPTGLLLVPSGRVLRSGWWSTGLHRGVIKAGVGLWGVAEAGATAPDIFEPLNSKDWGSRTAGFAKVSSEWLGRNRNDPSPAWRGLVPVVAGGVENSPNLDAETIYGTASWDWAIPGLQTDLHAGWGTGRFTREAFWGVGVVPAFLLGSTLKMTGEYAGRRGITGVRFAISRNLRLDFAMRYVVVPRPGPRDGWSITTDGVTLGVSQAGRLRLVDFFKTLFRARKEESRRA